MRGWRLPDKGLWSIPLNENVTAEFNLNKKTVKSKEAPSNLLRSQTPLPLQSINNVYKLKIKPELLHYYHVSTGNPTKPSCIATIDNNHYASWPGLYAMTVAE